MENKTLTGTDGHQIYQRGNYGGEEIPGTMTEAVAAKDGKDVTLTIDRDVQWYAKKIMKEATAQYSAQWGIAVVQNVQNGEILALADSDEIAAGSDEAKMNVSRAVSQTFEPGSIGKVISMSGYLQTGLRKPRRISTPCQASSLWMARPIRTPSSMVMSIGLWLAFSRNHRISAWSWPAMATRMSSGTNT